MTAARFGSSRHGTSSAARCRPLLGGEFDLRLRTLLASLRHMAGTSRPRTRPLVEHLGIVISPASVVNILHEAAGRVRRERELIFQAGIGATTTSQF